MYAPDSRRGAQPLHGVHVCMLTSRHPPDDDRIYFKEAWSLATMGARVTVVCPDKRPQPEVPSSLDVCFRFFPHQPAVRGAVGALKALVRAIRELRPDVIHCHEPDSLAAGLWAGNSHHPRVIYDSHEMWGAVAAERLSPLVPAGFSQSLFRSVERVLVARCQGAIGASSAIAEYLCEMLPARLVETILNVPRKDAFRNPGPRESRDFVLFVHDGHLTFDRGLVPLVEAVCQVARRLPVRLRIVGDVFGPEREWVEGHLRSNACEGVVQRTGWLPYAEVGAAIAQGDIGVIAFAPTPNHLIAAPNKLFNYMMCGLPILAPDFPRSEIAKVIRAEGCGRLVPEISTPILSREIEAFAGDRDAMVEMGRKALAASRRAYRWDQMEPRLLRLYQQVLEG